MTEKSVSKQSVDDSPLYKKGESCLYWGKFGEYAYQLAVEDGWLDVQGKLTSAGFDAIVSEQETTKKRKDPLEASASKKRSFKGKIKISGAKRKKMLPASQSTRKNFKTSAIHKSSSKADAQFKKDVKASLAKIPGKFVHFKGEDEGYRLVVQVPNEKNALTSHTFTGTIVEIKQDFHNLIEQYD